MDDVSARQVRELIAKGASGFTIGFTTNDCRKTYLDLLSKGVEFTQEPVEQPYGIDMVSAIHLGITSVSCSSKPHRKQNCRAPCSYIP